MERYELTKKVGIFGIIANFFLFVLKIIIGFLFKSQAMIADSFNSIGDSFASLMTFIGNKIASSESDEDHNFGHGKAEYIFSMFISISILVISIKLLYDSLLSIIDNNKVIFSWNLIIVCLITIIVKMGLYIYTKFLYNREKNILIKSSMLDHRNDIFLTIGVLISIILSKFGFYFVDGIVGVLISICFLLSGIKIFKESYDVLMDVSLEKEVKNKIIKMVKKNKSVIKVDDIHSVSIGYKYIVVLTISVDGKLSTFLSHEVANNIEKSIIQAFDNVKDVFIHINPV